MWLGSGLTFFLPWRAWDSGMLSLPMQTPTAAACAKLQRLAAAESALPRLARHRRGETIDQHLPIICVFVSFTITNYEFTTLVSSLVGLVGPLRLGFCYYVLRVTGIGGVQDGRRPLSTVMSEACAPPILFLGNPSTDPFGYPSGSSKHLIIIYCFL